MKKLFTLALALLVAFGGYSQVQSVSKKDNKLNVATMKKAPRIDVVNENVQSQPVMTSTRSDGELDYTTYDWQTNHGIINRTIVWPDGKVNFAFTCATDAGYSDRGTAIGTYDAVNDEWIPSEGRVENEKTGFGSIARYGENGIVLAAHTSTECGFYIIEDKDNIPAGAVPCALRLDPSVDPSWPIVMTSGPNRDIIHVVATGYGDSNLYYFRSSDGESWDEQNVVLPYLTEEYGNSWGANAAYWLETTEDNCLALVVNNDWSDGFVMYSYDDGATWERKVFYHHPDFNFTYDTESEIPEARWFLYPRWTSAVWGANHKLCVAYEWNATTGEPGSGSYYPSLGGVAFWSETLPYSRPDTVSNPWSFDPNNPMPPVAGQPFIMDSSYLYNDIYAAWPRWADQSYDNPVYFGYVSPLTDEGEWESWADAEYFNISDFGLHGSYNSGCAGMPALAIVPDSQNELITVWSSMDENNIDEAGNFFYKLFAAYSCDGGDHWSHPVNITNDFMWQFNEFVYVQAAVVGRTLIVAAQTDNATGTFVQGDDNDANDNYYQGFTFDIDDLFSWYDNTAENVSNNVHMNIFPNPAVDQLNVTLSKNAEIVVYNIMGQKVMSQKGHAGANSINISNLNSGIYFVNAGSETQKFIVK